MADKPPITRRLSTSLVRSSTTGSDAYAVSAALLITLFVFVVPSAAIVTDISVTRLLIAAATTYVLAIYSMKIVFEGICAATIVLAVFNITAVVTGSHIGVVKYASSTCYWWVRCVVSSSGSSTIPSRTWATAAG